MRTPSAAVALALLSFMTNGYAQQNGTSAEAALSNDTLQLRYIDRPRDDLRGGRFAGAFFLSEERDIVLSGDVLFAASFIPTQRVSVLFGPRAYAALLDEENNDVLALSVGVEARLELNQRSGFAIVGHAYLAPDILTFGSADQLTDLGARAEIRLGPSLIGFGGMRWFEFDLIDGGGERTLQEELFAGVGWKF